MVSQRSFQVVLKTTIQPSLLLKSLVEVQDIWQLLIIRQRFKFAHGGGFDRRGLREERASSRRHEEEETTHEQHLNEDGIITNRKYGTGNHGSKIEIP